MITITLPWETLIFLVIFLIGYTGIVIEAHKAWRNYWAGRTLKAMDNPKLKAAMERGDKLLAHELMDPAFGPIQRRHRRRVRAQIRARHE